ncbi:9972_t:CDS:2 [Diversispora eburnea]|uniref:9972_t:CDS:1 n=1 Tax=Diversispora eburnea TaxID=1213867 RepID=A0A9N8WM11_9GLOM|nr:9972_t:CDS:2 [Diversispora eburnea]
MRILGYNPLRGGVGGKSVTNKNDNERQHKKYGGLMKYLCCNNKSTCRKCCCVVLILQLMVYKLMFLKIKEDREECMEAQELKLSNRLGSGLEKKMIQKIDKELEQYDTEARSKSTYHSSQ